MSMLLEKNNNRIKVIIPNSEATISAQLKCIKDSEVTGFYMNDKEEIKKEFVDFLAEEYDYILNVNATIQLIKTIKDNFYEEYNIIFKDSMSSLNSSLDYFNSVNNNFVRIPKMYYSGQNNRYFKFENTDSVVKKLREILYGDITGFYISKQNNYYIITPFLVDNAKEILDKRKDKILNNNINIQYWTYSPGENGSAWDYCYDNKKMVIGWDAIGDLSQYTNREEIANAIKQSYEQDNPFNSISCVDDFINKLNLGDIVIAKIGQTKLLGYGEVVDNEYSRDESRDQYKNVRNVNWIKRGEWDIPQDLRVAQNTLKNITSYGAFAQKLIDIMEGERMKEKFREWLNNNPSTQNGSISNYVNSISITSREAIEDGFIDKSIYEIDNLDEFDKIDSIVRSDENERFNRRKIEHNHINTAALTNYRKFLEDYNNSLNTESVEDDSYTKDDFLDEVYIDSDKYDSIVSILEKKKNIILEGAPGVGKTFMAKRLAYSILGKIQKENLCLIQFHQSYSYEDFIEGYRPTENGFSLEKGIFYKFCKKAEENPNQKFYMIIDEINRGNLSKIFGELLMLIETDKRGDELELAYSKESFSVPSNLYIIGLMNTADRSLALIDYALRRRFSFIRIEPAFDNEKFIRDFNEKFDNDYSTVIEIIKKINDAIENDKSLGVGFKIGHSYFCHDIRDRKGNVKDIEDIIKYEILPLLEEYWYDDEDSIIQWKNALNGVIND